jgi:hypothetical protein
VYNRAPSQPRVYLEADNQLLRAGLARLARRSGLEVVDDVNEASIIITDREYDAYQGHISVSAGTDGVLVRMIAAPSNEEWSTLHRLVQVLLAPED